MGRHIMRGFAPPREDFLLGGKPAYMSEGKGRPCLYRKLRLGRSGGAVHLGEHVT